MTFEETFYGRPNTIKTYRSLFRNHIEFPADEQPDWETWTEESTRVMLGVWAEKKLSRNTKLTLVRLLARYVKFNGGPEIETKRYIRELERGEQQTEVTALSADQAATLMDITRRMEPKFYPVMLLAMHAGLRRGEIFGLRCEDVDMLSGKVKISHSYDGPTKNGKSRIVPMSPELAKALSATRNVLLRVPSEKVFEQFDPNPILRRLCAHARVPTLRFHDLRHTFASLALTGGVNAKQVSVWLGHSSVTTTLDIYWNLTTEEAALDFLPKMK
jgi:integrase